MPIGLAIGGAAIGAGATIVSGNKAAKATTDAAQQSADVQRYMYDQSRADTANQRAVGDSALNRLASMYGVQVSRPQQQPQQQQGTYIPGYGYVEGWGGQDTGASPQATTQAAEPYGGFQQTPGYAFRRDESMKAIQRMGSARGARFSPQTWKAGARYADNLASAEFENYGNALRSMAGIGQTATSQTGQLGVQTGQGIANAYTNAGNARASSYANTGAAINNLAGNLAYQGMTGGFGGGGFNQGLSNTNTNAVLSSMGGGGYNPQPSGSSGLWWKNYS